jgi:hypothetical protein
MPPAFAAAALTAVAGLLVAGSPARADELPGEYQDAVARGLAWLAKQQHADGHWDAGPQGYPISGTGLAGMALLMEGSTAREGKYQHHIRKAIRFLISRSQRGGLLGDRDAPGDGTRYMFGHGFALLFLASAYGEEDDADEQRKLADVLTRAVQFCGKAQTSRGGWGYLSAADGNDFDEGSVTVVQLQALRTARSAGIDVPQKVLDRGIKYLEASSERGGVLYRPTGGVEGGRPALTAGAVAAGFSAREYDTPLVKAWLDFCRQTIPLERPLADRDDLVYEYTHYYYAQVAHALGEDGYARLFPNSRAGDRLTWSKYRKGVFSPLLSRQARDGSWGTNSVGAVYATACFLTILQLDASPLPLQQR